MKNAALASAPPPLGYVRAVVDAGAIVTSYLLAGPRGSGMPVVLLTRADEADVVQGSLPLAMAARFRVIAACPPAGTGSALPGGHESAFSTWLREFLDGLGVSRASVVAEGPFGLPALGFALSDPARVARLVLLFRDAPDPSLPDAAAADRLNRSGLPILVLRASGDGATPPPEAEVADVIQFLSEEVEPTGR